MTKTEESRICEILILLREAEVEHTFNKHQSARLSTNRAAAELAEMLGLSQTATERAAKNARPAIC